ncbi:MAG: ATP-binding protein [Trichodesmium sp. ALOHA_ZT_67]|nr:ATP-binding protein [Trichodesmium sp. ALOHA_ZT_67]MCL2929207.1 ATP-binding protein [Trichodesmium sp. MAG_R01]MDT9340023.1 ATP-binding protein [Trichodesmium erythraeum 21-75]
MKLEEHQFIRYFGKDKVAKISQFAIIKKFSPQDILVDQGNNSDALFLILEGEALVSKKSEECDNYIIITSIKSNDFFGELGIIDRQPRSCRVVALRETTVAQIYYDHIIDILAETQGDVVLKILSILSQRLRSITTEYVNQLAYKEKMTLIGEMVNTIIHDFRSPFTGIQLSSSMLKELHPDQESQEWCDLISMQVQRMLNMAEEVLAFSQGNTKLYSRQVDIAKLLQNFQKLNQVYIDSTFVELIVSFEESLIINADENKINRALQNLLANAVEAVNKDKGQIEIKAKRKDPWVEITFSDNGSGIPEEIKNSLFKPFVSYGKQGGIGLGTAIVKTIVDAHGGEICFESIIGKGTTFYLRFPVAKID